MNPSVQIAAVFVVLTSQLANAQAIKRDVLGISLGMPVAAVAKRDIVASAGEWTPPQEDVIPVGDYKCKKLGAPWKLSSGQLSCRIDKLSSLSLDVALLTDPPAIQSITHNRAEALPGEWTTATRNLHTSLYTEGSAREARRWAPRRKGTLLQGSNG